MSESGQSGQAVPTLSARMLAGLSRSVRSAARPEVDAERIAEIMETRFAKFAEARPEILAQHYADGGQLNQAVDLWMTAGEQGRYGQGCTHATMAGTMGRHTARWSQSPKPVSVRIGVCNPTP